MCRFQLFVLCPPLCEKYKSKMSVALEPVQTEEPVELVEPVEEAVVEEAIPEVDPEVVQEEFQEAVQPKKNVGGPRQHQNTWRRQKQ